MATQISSKNQPNSKAYIITGPTSGVGRATAFEVAKHSTVILVRRDRQKRSETQTSIEREGRRAVSVVFDPSDNKHNYR